MTGTIKTTVRDRGFGFIADPTGATWFFHLSDCGDVEAFYALREGDEVTFDNVEPTPPKGKQAVNVERIPAGAPEPIEAA
jgi:cold shock CspA family protein